MEENKPPLIHKKIISILKDVEVIAKTRESTQGGYTFRSIDDVYNYMNPLFKKRGVYVTTEIVKKEIRDVKNSDPRKKFGIHIFIDAKFIFRTSDGSSVDTTMSGEAIGQEAEGTQAAISIAYKQALIVMFNIPTSKTLQVSQDSPPQEIHEIEWMTEEQYVNVFKAIREGNTTIYPETEKKYMMSDKIVASLKEAHRLALNNKKQKA